MNLERSTESVASRATFFRRVLAHFAIAATVIGGSLLIGVLGYRFAAGLGWVDSILNASMILAGMGPVDVMPNDGAKLFSAGYALMSGLVFIAVSGIVISPMLHRVLHRFHVEKDDEPAAK